MVMGIARARPLLFHPLMRIRALLTIVGLLTVLHGAAEAQTAGLYLRGHGGFSGGSAGELEPGGDEPSLGPVLGAELGANIMLFNGYINYDRYLDHGSVTRGVLGLQGGLGFSGFRLTGRVGAGILLERGDVFGGEADHTGVVARVGAAFDRRISSGLWLGVAVDAEYFALKPSADEVESSVHSGADIFASLRLSFELGI
jgi:hypothetical protein